MKPKIGITSQYDNYEGVYKLSPFYIQAVEAAGGIPLLLPYTSTAELSDAIAQELDGFIFSGGANVDPVLYGETAQENCGSIEYERDIFELSLCKKAIELNKPVFAICRGCQLITVASGGTLVQHKDGHVQSADKHVASHSVNVTQNTLLYDILKAEYTDTNSFHHQTVKTTGDLRVCATDSMGSIEAVFMPGQKFHLGVQWHPERTYFTSRHSRLLFEAFISCCC